MAAAFRGHSRIDAAGGGERRGGEGVARFPWQVPSSLPGYVWAF